MLESFIEMLSLLLISNTYYENSAVWNSNIIGICL